MFIKSTTVTPDSDGTSHYAPAVKDTVCAADGETGRVFVVCEEEGLRESPNDSSILWFIERSDGFVDSIHLMATLMVNSTKTAET